MGKLTNERHEMFCQEYVIDKNAARSYGVAFKRCSTDKTTTVNSSRLLANAKVQQRVKELGQVIANKLEITQEQVMQAWKNLAEFNIADIIEFNGTEAYVKDFSKIPREVLYAVNGMETVQKQDGSGNVNWVTKLKFESKTKALDALSRVRGMYNDKLEVTNKSIEDALDELGD